MRKTMIGRAVYVSINAGLGNQMFQFACGYARSRALGVPLKVRWDGTDRHVTRKLELMFFDDSIEQLTTGEQLYWELHRLQVPLVRHFPFTRPVVHRLVATYHRERPEFVFDPIVEQLSAPCFLQGNWQNPRYFRSRTDELRRFFRRPNRLGAEAAELSRQIRSTPSVSIHVRLGDYGWGPHADLLGGVCTRAYYAKAVARILELAPESRFFLFSDEPDKARALLPENPKICFPSGAPLSAHEDLLLMSQCRHHIISNSTFAWWGAWLNDDSRKVVVAPEWWMSEKGRRRFDLREIYPDSWLRVGG